MSLLQKLAFFWHVNCEQLFMARKLNPQKLPRHNNAEPPNFNRRTPPVAALYLMQLRTQAVKISSDKAHTRVEISAEEEAVETPQPVKITKKG